MFPTPAQRDLAGFATKLAAYGETPRYWRINRFEAFYNGQQYDGRPSFWDNAYPLRERAPAVQTGFARAAVNRLATLVFGDRSFPRLTVGNRVLRAALSDAERKALQALVDEVATALVLSHRMRQVLVEGLKCGSACVVTGLVDGAPAVEILPSKWCTPTLRRDGSVESVVVQWKHPDETGANKWAWHRREITAAHDRVYEPVPFREGREPEWAGVPFVDAPLRFCPVVWVRNLRPATAGAADVDGCSLIDGMEDEVEALDLELSQLYRNALYNGEPQMVKIGGAPASPAADGRQARDGSAPMGAMGSIAKWFVSGEGGGAVRKSPGRLWEIASGGDAKMVESTGAGAQIIKGAIDELRRVLCDATGVVLVDPHTLGNGDLSARALTLMHAPMLDVADNLRVEYGAVVVAIVNQILRHVALAGAAAVTLAAADAAGPALARLSGNRPPEKQPDGTLRAGAPVWLGAPIDLAWGPYFEPSATDRKEAVETATKANGGRPVVSQRAAVASVAPLFGTEDVDAEVAAIDGDEGAQREAVHATMRAIGGEEKPAEPEAPEVTMAPPVEVDAPADVAAADAATAAPPVEKAADAALNSAQVSSMVDVVVKVATGELPRDAAKAIIKRAFLVDDAGADEILGSAGAGFEPKAQPKPAPFFGGG